MGKFWWWNVARSLEAPFGRNVVGLNVAVLTVALSSKYDSTSDKLYFHQCFQILDKLGSGSFGDVFKVKCKEDGKLYAVKRAKEKFAGIADRQRKLQEVQKHEQLPSHPNCVKFYKAWEERQHLYIQTELCSKSCC
ncbi:hypothetical protein JTE90_000035 [Oedothorax gibbosus]|uniref:non-specific serine/threonine protein kinase n=1 Tax=Oedothorax gibbosus TaxID=931172 RepID=A0AAV6TI76_9ARAC|nr:hypothetical protein JTE90_000035 [Oedothorax gibbosus]KAG8171468.1 hypothetical protein JTE90_000035 [Oedothorax gibbosus]